VTWFWVDDHLHSHRKQRKAGLEAIGLWTLSGSWCADTLSDGFIPEDVAEAWARKRLPMLSKRLVAAGLWEPHEVDGEPGWLFHDWEDWQKSRAQVEDRREKRAASGRAGGLASGRSRRSKIEASASPSVAPEGTNGEALASPVVRESLKQTRTPTHYPSTSALRAGDADAPPTLLDVPDQPSPDGTPNAGDVVAAWVQACTGNGVQPSTSQRAQVGRQARELLATNAPDRVLAAAEQAGAKGYASIDRELTSMNGRVLPAARSDLTPAGTSPWDRT
jgi:hypothetical protein